MKITEKQFKDIVKEEIKKALLTEAPSISFYEMLKLAKPGDKLSLNFQRDGYDWMGPVRDTPFKAGNTYEASVGKDGKILIFHEYVGTFFKRWNKSRKTKEDMIDTIKKNVNEYADRVPAKKGKKWGPCDILNCKESTVTREGLKPKTISAIMKDPDVMNPKKAEPKKTKEYGDFLDLNKIPYLDRRIYPIIDVEKADLLGNFLAKSKKPYAIVNFMADWCKPCKKELPHFKTFLSKYGNNFDFYMIDADGWSERNREHEKWIKNNNNIIPDNAKHFYMKKENYSLPFTYVIDVAAGKRKGGVHKGIMEIDGAFSSAELLTSELKKRINLEPKKKKAIQYKVCKELPIKLGCKGKFTRNLQRYLYRILSGTLRKEVKQLNEFTLPPKWQDFVTGKYNKETEEAVKAFQERFKMAPSGVVDDKTLDKLSGEIETGKYAPLKKTTTTPPAVTGTPKAKVPVPVPEPKEPEAQTTTPTAPTGDERPLFGLGALGGDKFADAVRRAKYAAPPRAATAVAPTAVAAAATTGAAALDQKQKAALLAKNIEMVKKFPPETQGRPTGQVNLNQKCRYGPPPGKSGYEFQICKQGMVCIKRSDGKPVTYWSPTGRCKEAAFV